MFDEDNPVSKANFRRVKRELAAVEKMIWTGKRGVPNNHYWLKVLQELRDRPPIARPKRRWRALPKDGA